MKSLLHLRSCDGLGKYFLATLRQVPGLQYYARTSVVPGSKLALESLDSRPEPALPRPKTLGMSGGRVSHRERPTAPIDNWQDKLRAAKRTLSLQ